MHLSRLTDAIRRWLIRRLATHYPENPTEWATETATCAARCGRPLVLGEPYFTVYREEDRMHADGEIASLDPGYELAYIHPDCWTSDRVTMQVVLGGPDHARLTSGAADITL